MVDMSLLGFIEHVAGFGKRLTVAKHKRLAEVGKIVVEEAKKEIGTYQRGNNGPFADWEDLHDATKEDRARKNFPEDEPGLRTGEMRDSIYSMSDDKSVFVGSDSDKLLWFELGTSKQPPRSVLGVAVIHKEKEITRLVGSAVVNALLGEQHVRFIRK